jgi:CBS domain-containing protein
MENAVEKALSETKIRQLALPPPACVQQGTSLTQTIGMMKELRAGCVLVCDGDRIVGIFTERDLLNKVIGTPIDDQTAVDEFMTPDPKPLNPDDPIAEAIMLMDQGGYRDVPLVDGQGRVAGVITVRHVIDLLAEHFPAEVLNLPPRIRQKMDAPEGA